VAGLISNGHLGGQLTVFAVGPEGDGIVFFLCLSKLLNEMDGVGHSFCIPSTAQRDRRQNHGSHEDQTDLEERAGSHHWMYPSLRKRSTTSTAAALRHEKQSDVLKRQTLDYRYHYSLEVGWASIYYGRHTLARADYSGGDSGDNDVGTVFALKR
jgi:hypothetical protein